MNTDKKHIQHLANICLQKGIKYAIISPGSRCAPLIIAFNRTKGINCLSVIDERSAGFIALGIAQQTNMPVALICTSGSATLNYAPALAEAFYQKIPLLVLSADRPNEWIDQGENQSINQFEVYKNYIKKSYQLPLQIHTEKDLWYSDRIVSEALNTCIYPDFGPVHINIPLREPLYNLTEEIAAPPKIIRFEQPKYTLAEPEFDGINKEWHSFKKILIVVGGQKTKNEKINSLLNIVAKQSNIIVIKESISNVSSSDFIEQIDPNIEIINENNLEDFVPDLVLSFGGGVVSKKLKFWLRKQSQLKHWHITNSFEHWDNFQALSKVIQMDICSFFQRILKVESKIQSNYKEIWQTLNKQVQKISEEYINNQEYNDFAVFNFLIDNLPSNCLLQLGNSTPVRYVNLLQLDNSKNVQVNSNRGVSGIDGILSTALGASIVEVEKTCICICGDIASLYDSNAWLNSNIGTNFKVIVINNNGGNIFRIIPGPDKLNELEKFFETSHKVSFKNLAKTYSCQYFGAENMQELTSEFENFLNENKQPAILEIKTNGIQSAEALKGYFSYLLENMAISK